MTQASFSSVTDMIAEVLDWRYFHPDPAIDGETAIHARVVPGRGKLVVILGDNASGKSFLRRLLQQVCHEQKIEFMGLSMQGRTQRFNGWSGLIYGAENDHSTGVNSSRTVTTGISTCRSRTTPHVIFWDEPDVGLSDEYAAGVGKRIRDFAIDMPEHTFGAFVVSHSKALIRELIPASPHCVFVGQSDHKSIEAWTKRRLVPRDVEELQDEGIRRLRLITRILNDKRRQDG